MVRGRGRMPVPHDDVIRRELNAIEELTDADRERVMHLGLPQYESTVIGYLRAACRLLERDGEMSVLERSNAWARWQAGIDQALEGAMRFRENEQLVMAIGVLCGLLPGVYSHATLRSFKALEDALTTAQRCATVLKRERSRYRRRMRERVERVSVWVGPAGDILQDHSLNDRQRQELQKRGYENVWGVQFSYHQPEGVMWLVRAVLPVVAQSGEQGTIAAPRPERAHLPGERPR